MISIPFGMMESLHKLAASRVPNEMVCLIGAEQSNPDFLTVCVEVRNDATEPTTHWVVRPFEQFEVEAQFALQGRTLRAVAHSHPARDTIPSKTDTKFCPADLAMIIVSVPDKEIAVYEGGVSVDWTVPVGAAA